MTAQLNRFCVLAYFASAVFVFTATASIAQTTQPRATHDGGVLYVPPPRVTDAFNWLQTAPVEGAGVQVPASNDMAWQRAIATHASLIGVKSRLLRMVSDPNSDVLKTAWYNRFKSPSEAADWLAQNLRVAQIPGTALIEIWIDGAIAPDDAGKIIDEIGSHYIDDHKRIQLESLLNRKNALDQLRAKHETTIRQLRQDTSRAQGELQMDSTGKSSAIAQKEQEVFQLIIERTKTENEAADAVNAMESAKSSLEKAQMPPAVQMQVNQNPRVSTLRQQLDALEIEINSQAATNQAAPLKTLTDKRKATQDRLESVLAEVRSSATAVYLDELQNRLAETQRRLDEMAKSIEKLHLDISDLSFQLSNYVQRYNEMNALEEINRRERDQLDRLNSFISSVDLNDIVWVEHPPKISP